MQRNPALLPGKAQHHRIGKNAVAQQLAGDAFGVHAAQRRRVLQCVGDQGHTGLAGVAPVGVFHEGGGRCTVAVHDHMAASGTQTHGRFLARGDDGVAANHQIGAGHAHARGSDGFLGLADQHVAPGGATFLGQAAGVLGDDAFALHVRGHAQQLADGDHTGTAHACHHQAPHAIVGGGQIGDGWGGDGVGMLRAGRCCRFFLAQRAAFDRDEAGAKAFDARDVFVAGALVDLALAAEAGFQRFDADAIALHAAVATAFAHQVVDHHAHRRVNQRATLAAATLFGGAGLVVNDDGGAGNGAELALDAV